MQGGALFGVIKNIAGVAASMPHIGYQVVGMINCIPVGADNGNLPGDGFLTRWVAATVKALR